MNTGSTGPATSRKTASEFSRSRALRLIALNRRRKVAQRFLGTLVKSQQFEEERATSQ